MDSLHQCKSIRRPGPSSCPRGRRGWGPVCASRPAPRCGTASRPKYLIYVRNEQSRYLQDALNKLRLCYENAFKKARDAKY